jgi:hypothetical protein
MTSWRAKHKGGVDELERRKNRTKARVRSKVEWPFRILKLVIHRSAQQLLRCRSRNQP